MSRQICEVLKGKKIAGGIVGHTPHKLSWFYGDPENFKSLLQGRKIDGAAGVGGLVEIKAGGANILFGDGANIRYHAPGASRPSKHQMLLEFEDRSAITAAVQMYGGMGAFEEGGLDNPYYLVAKKKPSPLSAAFDEDYFHSIFAAPSAGKLSLKALLATEQRIPGLGNGVLQDILFNSRMHPKKKVGSMSDDDESVLFKSVKGTLAMMAEKGGRDTEMDIFGRNGGYRTVLSKNTAKAPCPVCGSSVQKEAYLGGSIYYCQKCQRM